VNRYNGKPYKIYPDGKVDHATWLGSRLYGNVCFHCHGDRGNGSSFAPSLHDALDNMSYEDFVATVTNGLTNVNTANTKVMPSFGENKTVMENLDGIYAYLKAASNNDLPSGDLKWKGPKNE
jgi:mono/diheme cytochrome c family protein